MLNVPRREVGGVVGLVVQSNHGFDVSLLKVVQYTLKAFRQA